MLCISLLIMKMKNLGIGETGQTQNLYTSQIFSDHALFGLKGPNNGGGVSIQTDIDKITLISIFTNSTGNDILPGSLQTNITDASTELANKEITVTASGWQTFIFNQPIMVKKEETYHFFVQSNNGIAMFRKADGKLSDNAIMVYNYNVEVLGGFAKIAYLVFRLNGNDEKTDDSFMSNTNHSIALFLINANTNNSAFAFVPNSDPIRSFRVYLTKSAPITFMLTTAPGNEVKTIKTIFQTVSSNGWQTVDFGENISVIPRQMYYVHIATTSG